MFGHYFYPAVSMARTSEHNLYIKKACDGEATISIIIILFGVCYVVKPTIPPSPSLFFSPAMAAAYPVASNGYPSSCTLIGFAAGAGRSSVY
jgi:hypothetical protein